MINLMNLEYALHHLLKRNSQRGKRIIPGHLKINAMTFLSRATRVLLVAAVCSFSIFSTSLHAKSNPSANQLIEYLVQEKNNLSLSINEAKVPQAPINLNDYERRSKENDALIALNNAKIVNLENFLSNQRKLQLDYSNRLKHLQQSPLAEGGQISSQEQITRYVSLNEINKKTIELITENLDLAKKFRDELIHHKQDLGLWYAHEQMQEKLDKLRAQKNKLNDTLIQLYDNSLKLQQENKTDNNFTTNYQLEARILLNNQIINLTQFKMTEVDLQKRLVKADYLLQKSPDIRTLQRITEQYKAAVDQLSDMEQSLKKMVTLIKNEQGHLANVKLSQQYDSLLRILNSKIEGIAIQQQTLQEDLENHEQELKKQLSVRQSLTEYHIDSWPTIMDQLVHIPGQMYNYLKTLIMKVKDNYLWQDVLPATLIWFSLGLLLTAALALHKLLGQLTQDKERSRFSGHLYDGALILLHRNIPQMSIIATIFLLLYLNHISFSNYQLLLNLLAVWLTFRSLILIARLILLERISDSSGKDVRLYYRLKWLLLAGGWTTALMVLSHQLPLSILLQDIFSRLFMMFLLVVSLVTWKSREIVKHLLDPFLENKKRYIRHAIMLLVMLIPLTLLTTAILGLIGYINLAWTMSMYQVQILLIISAYVLLRGLLFDALELMSEWMISSVNNGWLWIEVFLKPLDKVLRVILVILSLMVLSGLLGWYSDDVIRDSVRRFAEYPLINLSGIHITTKSIIEFIILFSFFAWTSKWTREFCYRWLYRDSRDAGIRNSLSVFTQYAVILIGGFIALRVLGFDFSGMSMILGGLAVGMGFGLRDFASNIVGGLMLLIERPVREGDLITLGTHEGRVAHIGIRSMRVSSWDNTEVLIPNAETFNKPFTNWTHQDSIVRTVIPIKVSRADDPSMIQQLILDVLTIIPEIVDEPPPQVFLKQIDDALIEFEVRYFINVQLYTRFEIRSKVLFAITAQFKAAGVKPPIPPISIEFREGAHHGDESIKLLED